MANVQWSNDTSFVPIAAWNDNDKIMGLQFTSGKNAKGTATSLATYMQVKLNFNRTYQNIYNDSTLKQTQLNVTDDPVNFLNNAGNNVLSITGGGTKSSLPINQVTSDQSIDTAVIGSVNTNNNSIDLADPITITAQLNDGFLVGSSFEMLRVNTGMFTLSCVPGVTLNGADGGSIELSLLFSRLKVTKIATNKYTAVEYSGAAATPTMQQVYDSGRDTALGTGLAIEYSIPDNITQRFVTTNLKNGENGNLICQDYYYGKDQIGAVMLYGVDSLSYRGNLGNPSAIESSSRIFTLLENGLFADYLRMDAGTRVVTCFKDFEILGVPTLKKNSGICEFKYWTNYNGSVSDTSILFSSQKKTSTGSTLLSDALRITVADATSATYSENYRLQAFHNNVAQNIFDYTATDGSYGSTKVINATSGAKEQIMTSSDIPAVSAKVYGFMNFQSNVTATAITQNVWATPTLGGGTSYVLGSVINGFDINPNVAGSGKQGLRYTLPEARKVEVIGVITARRQSAGAASTTQFAISKNGIVIGALDTITSAVVDVDGNTTVTINDNMVQNDSYQIVSKNLSNNDDFIFRDGTITVKNID